MLTEIRTRIAQQLNIPVDNITADSKLVDDLKAGVERWTAEKAIV